MLKSDNSYAKSIHRQCNLTGT